MRFEQEKQEGMNAIMYYSRRHDKYYVIRGSSFVISAFEAAIAGAVGVGHLLHKGFNVARSKLRHLDKKR